MDWFWNWGGECFGYRNGESLFTYFGKEAGRFDGEEIYGSNGRYPGEVMIKSFEPAPHLSCCSWAIGSTSDMTNTRKSGGTCMVREK